MSRTRITQSGGVFDQFTTRAALTASGSPLDGALAFVKEAEGLGSGSGFYRYSASSAATVDGLAVVAAGGTGRWLRCAEAPAAASLWHNVKDYGAVGDGSTDDTAAILAAVTAANAANNATVYFPAGRYAVSASIPVHQCVTYLGEGVAWPGGGFPGTEILVIAGNDIDVFASDNLPSGGAYIHHTRIEGMCITAAAGQTSGSGIHVRNTGETFAIRDVRCDSFPDAGIRINGQNAPNQLQDLSLNGCTHGIWYDSPFTSSLVSGLSGNDNDHLIYISNYDNIPTDSGFDFQLTLIGAKSECGPTSPVTVHNPVILCQNLNRGSIVVVGGNFSDWSSSKETDPAKAVIKLTSTAVPETSDVRATGGVVFIQPSIVNYPVILQDDILSKTINHLTGSVNSENSSNTWPRIGSLVYNSPNFLGVTAQYAGAGSPEGVITAGPGSLYHRSDGAEGTTLYVKGSGTGNTGWDAIVPLHWPSQANSSSNLTLTTGWQNIPGASTTATRAGTYLVTGTFDFNVIGDAGANLLGALLVGASRQTGFAVLNTQTNSRATVAQTWVLTGVAASTVLQLQAEKDAGTGTSVAYSPQTSIVATWFGP